MRVNIHARAYPEYFYKSTYINPNWNPHQLFDAKKKLVSCIISGTSQKVFTKVGVILGKNSKEITISATLLLLIKQFTRKYNRTTVNLTSFRSTGK